ncbi:branched-chain amino acid ABC transporter permease [Xanthobacter pseudotagetidis]|uniref:branched-chain amino acid ABC transporter permease n=1 Tax=Xanthobacter pseudotagetidis TaxID=3119911 RepID=UPI00372B2FBD
MSVEPISVEPITAPAFPAAPARGINLRAAVWPALALAGIVLPTLLGDYGLHLAVSGGILAIGGMCLTVLTGTAGLLSLGQAAFMAVGAFTAALLATQLGLNLLPAVVAAAALGLALGGLLALLTLRVSGLYLAVATFGFHYVVEIVASDIEIKVTRATGFLLDPPVILGFVVDTQLRWWGLVVVALALVWTALSFLRRGHVGRAWTFLREDPTAATVFGISQVRARAAVFTLTSAITAAAGVLSAYHLGNVQAGSYSIHMAVAFLTIVALGGPGSLRGALIASYVVLLLPVAIDGALRALHIPAAAQVAGIENVVLGTILAASLLKAPSRTLAWLRKEGGR